MAELSPRFKQSIHQLGHRAKATTKTKLKAKTTKAMTKTTLKAKTTKATKAMTTNGRMTPRRDKHPARSARVLTTGISLASVLGLTSAYSVAAQQNSPTSGNEPIASALGVVPSVTPPASAAAVAPTEPAPATPATVITLTQSAPATQSAPVAQPAPTSTTPVVAPAQSAPAVAPVTIMVLVPNPPATRSSGSK